MSAPKQGILSISIKDVAALYASYMPFVKGGALFIPTTRHYRLGDEVFMLVALMDENEKTPIVGRIVWMTPKGAQANRVAGIGVQFSEIDQAKTRTKIENYLAGTLASDRQTHTL